MKDSLKWIDIDLRALAQNLRWARRRMDKKASLMAVVKADAYGHGAVPVSKAALSAGADCLGVLSVAEALRLRNAGIKRRIVVLAPPLPGEASLAARAGLEITVDSLALARALAGKARKPVSVHVDLDFGLARWGVKPKALPALLDAVARLKKIKVAGISTHLDYVPGKNAVEAEEKLAEFNRISHKAQERFPGLIRHCANSAILLDFPHWQMDMVRVGNLLYGINRTSVPAPLKRPWTLNARITSVVEVAKGQSIGYSAEYLAPRKMKVASLPVGYSDGLTMEPAERFIGFGKRFHYWGWLGKTKVPFVSRCGIAHVLVDVTAAPRVRVGDVVQLPIRRTAASALLPRIYR